MNHEACSCIVHVLCVKRRDNVLTDSCGASGKRYKHRAAFRAHGRIHFIAFVDNHLNATSFMRKISLSKV